MSTVTEHPVKDGQSKVEDFPLEERYSFANLGSSYPEFCIGGEEHQWKNIERPEMYRSGLTVDKCTKCDWVHKVDTSD